MKEKTLQPTVYADAITINLDRPRVMRLTTSAFRMIIRELKESPLTKEFWNDFGSTNIEKVSVVFWASLRFDDPEITREQADALADSLPFHDLVAKVNACIAAAMPSPEKRDEIAVPAK